MRQSRSDTNSRLLVMLVTIFAASGLFFSCSSHSGSTDGSSSDTGGANASGGNNEQIKNESKGTSKKSTDRELRAEHAFESSVEPAEQKQNTYEYGANADWWSFSQGDSRAERRRGLGGGRRTGEMARGQAEQDVRRRPESEESGEDTESSNRELVFIPRKRTRFERREDGATTGKLTARRTGEDDEEKEVTFPLKETIVDARISGLVGTVQVNQVFENPYSDTIEATYRFPLPHTSAINGFRMKLGDRVIRGVIRSEEKAREMYEEARRSGQKASLLTQERPNIFEEKVANISPGETIDVGLTFFQYVTYQKGEYEWVFPLVVGPRYIGGPDAVVGEGDDKSGRPVTPDNPYRQPPQSKDGGNKNETGGDRDPNPSYRPPDQVPGNLVNMDVQVDTGVSVNTIQSPSHQIQIDRKEGAGRFDVTIADSDRLPNKDFVLRWTVDPEQVEYGLMTHQNEERGDRYFSMLVQPPNEKDRDGEKTERDPIEWVFVIDRSGSMEGSKMTKARSLAKDLLGQVRSGDRIRLISFANDITTHFSEALRADDGHMEQLRAEIDRLQGDGGTQLPGALRQATNLPVDPDRNRVYMVLSDALHNNEQRVLQQVQKRSHDRYFFTAIGQAPNRFLSSRLAEIGNGVAYSLRSDENTGRVLEKLQGFLVGPMLRNISIQGKGVKLEKVYPSPERIGDVFAGRPLLISGTYSQTPEGTEPRLELHAEKEDEDIQKEFPLSRARNGGEETAVLWARLRIRDLMNDYMLARKEEKRKRLEQQITNLGLQHGLMTQFTSYVAVDDSEGTGKPPAGTVEVPAQIPEGMKHEEITGLPGETPIEMTSDMLGITFRVREDNRIEVQSVKQGRGAYRQGLRKGALVTGVNGKTGPEGADLRQALNGWSPGETLSISFRLGEEQMKLTWSFPQKEDAND